MARWGWFRTLAWLVAAGWAGCLLAAAPVRVDGRSVLVWKQLEFLPDPTSTLRVSDLDQPEVAARFLPAARFDATAQAAGTYWLRVRLTNPDARAREIVVSVPGPWSLIELQGYDGTLVRSGMSIPLAGRAFEATRLSGSAAPFIAIPDVLPGNSTRTIHVKAEATQRHGLPAFLELTVHDRASLLADERTVRAVLGAFVGILLALAASNALHVLVLREAVFAYFLLHLAGLALVTIAIYGLGFEYLWPGHPALAQDALVHFKVLTVVGLLQYARKYLDTRYRAPWADRALQGLTIAALLVSVAALLPGVSSPEANQWQSSVWLAALVAMLVSGAAAWWRGQHLAGAFVVGNLLTIAGFVVVVLHEAAVLPWQWAQFGVLIGSSLEALVLSQALALRVNRMRSELTARALAEATERRAQEARMRALVEEQNARLEMEVARRTADAERERARADALLHEMLPESVAGELKESGRSIPRRHENVSILFTDFVAFTETVSTLPPQRMVEELNDIFQGFDDLVETSGLEKIKTIGDAYMAAAGVPDPCEDHAVRCVRTGLAMQRWLHERNVDAAIKWRLRVGVHSGAVVAGVVGRKKYAYDIWGDAVNLASRMESAGAPDRVNISAYTYDLVRHRFSCSYRGKVAAKGKGEVDMYFVESELA